MWKGSPTGNADPMPGIPPHLAVEASVALRAGALVGAIAVLAGATMQAGPRVTLVDVVLAVAAREAGRAQAGEGVDAVHTSATVEAGAEGGGEVSAQPRPHLQGATPGSSPAFLGRF